MAATGNEAMNLRQARSLFRRVMVEMANRIGDSQDQMAQEISAAVAAEAAAREKQDGLLQDAVDSKLQPDSLVAGDNVSIDKTSQPGRVVISATVGDAYVLPVATSAALGGVKSGDKIQVASDGTMDVGSGAITADKIADGVIPDVQGFITKETADSAYAPKSHTHTASQVGGLTANAVAVADASGNLSSSTVTKTELGYLDGVTSAIQTQLNGKSPTSHTHTVSQITDFPEIPEIDLATDAEAKGFLGY